MPGSIKVYCKQPVHTLSKVNMLFSLGINSVFLLKTCLNHATISACFKPLTRLVGMSLSKDLIQQLKGDDYRIRADALFQLSLLDPQDAEVALPLLISGLGDSHPLVRGFAARSIGDIGIREDEALDALEQLSAQDPIDSVRSAASQALFRLKASRRYIRLAPSSRDDTIERTGKDQAT